MPEPTPWRIRTPAGDVVAKLRDACPKALARRYARIKGEPWPALAARGYRCVRTVPPAPTTNPQRREARG